MEELDTKRTTPTQNWNKNNIETFWQYKFCKVKLRQGLMAVKLSNYTQRNIQSECNINKYSVLIGRFWITRKFITVRPGAPEIKVQGRQGVVFYIVKHYINIEIPRTINVVSIIQQAPMNDILSCIFSDERTVI